MTESPVPPPDPNIPKHRHQQIETLTAMFGEAPPAGDPGPKRRRRSRATPSRGVTVAFTVAWRRRKTDGVLRKLTDEDRREYEQQRRSANRYAGEYEVQHDRDFEEWTGDDINLLVTEMLDVLRSTPRTAQPSALRSVSISMNNLDSLSGRNDRLSLYISDGCGQFSAEVDLRDASIHSRAWADWLTRLAPYQFHTFPMKLGTRTTIHECKPVNWIPGEPERTSLPPINVDTTCDERDEDDDDLDAIEKAARRSLHGEKNIPNTSRSRTDAQTERADAGDYGALLDAVHRLSNMKCAPSSKSWYLQAAARFCDALAKGGAQ